MQVSVQKPSKSQVELKIEIPAGEFQSFFEKAILNLGKDLEIEGFRKGHAPKEMVEKQVGKEKILNEAAQLCIKENYVKAVLEQKLEPLGQPEVEILKMAPGNPFEFKAKFSILPEIELPDYKEVASKIKRREAQVSEEEIERLKAEKERTEKERVRQEILEKIAEKSKIEIPEVLIESEKKRMLENMKQQVSQALQMKFEDYLQKIQKTEKELLDSFLPEIEKRIKNSLVLKAIEKKENIEVPEEEAEIEKNKISKIYHDLDESQLKEYAKAMIRDEKTLQILESLIK